MRVGLLTLGVVIAACGSGTPVAPTPAVPSARLQFVLGEIGEQSFKGWEYVIRFDNAGRGCANAVTGTTIFRNAQAQETARSDWALDPARLVRPAERVTFIDCCLPFYAAEATSAATVTLKWTDAPCD